MTFVWIWAIGWIVGVICIKHLGSLSAEMNDDRAIHQLFGTEHGLLAIFIITFFVWWLVIILYVWTIAAKIGL